MDNTNATAADVNLDWSNRLLYVEVLLSVKHYICLDWLLESILL